MVTLVHRRRNVQVSEHSEIVASLVQTRIFAIEQHVMTSSAGREGVALFTQSNDFCSSTGIMTSSSPCGGCSSAEARRFSVQGGSESAASLTQAMIFALPWFLAVAALV